MTGKILTEQMVASWETGGSSQFTQAAREIFTSPDSDFTQKLSHIRAMVLEAVMAAIHNILAITTVANFLSNLYRDTTKRTKPVDAEAAVAYVGPENPEDPLLIPSLVVDVLWLIDQQADQTIIGDAAQQQKSRLIALGKELVMRDFIPHVLMRERLELDFQQAIGLISDTRALAKKEVRMRTSLLYVQTKYNLLREESEGYSKLVAEIFSNLPPLYDTTVYNEVTTGTLTADEICQKREYGKSLRQQAVEQQAELMMTNISSLIGYFDLDPNRVLDVILDLFTANIAEQWDFFVRLLEKSPWRNQKGESSTAMPVNGKILGFKFDWYNNKSNARHAPENLVYVAAVMIKHNLVNIDDLYPYLTPADESMPVLFKEYLDDLKSQQRTAGRFQVAGLTGTLGDEGKASTAATAQTQEATTPEKKPRKSNQKAELVAALLAIGDVKHAFALLDRLPNLPALHTDIVENLSRWIQCAIEPWDVKPLAAAKRSSRPAVEEFAPPLHTISVKISPLFERVLVGKRKNPPRYKFFYSHWKDEVPKFRNAIDLLTKLRVFLIHIGPHLHRDPVLLGKIIRIGASHVAEARRRLEGHTPTITNEDIFKGVNLERHISDWLKVVANYLLPALSRADPNPANSQGLWAIIREFPYEKRFALYGEWKNRLYSDIPEMKLAKAGCERDCRYIMSRLSKDSGKQSGRQIGKVVHSNPVVAFSYIIKQLESYDNMIPHVVDASRYLTELEFDILPYCLIEALSDNKSRVEANGLTIQLWMKSLATFTGQVFRKHGMELEPLLRFVVNQLCVGNIHDLTVLQELISYMSGIKPMEEATEAQLEALAGGETLKREALFWENLRTTRRPGMRLCKALVDTQFAKQVAVLISQRRQEAAFAGMDEEFFEVGVPKELKVLGWETDFCQRTLLQFLDFLTTMAGEEAFATAMPDVEDLVGVYGLEPSQAFLIARVKLGWKIKQGSKAIESNGTPGPDDKENVQNGDAMDIDSKQEPGNKGDAMDIDGPAPTEVAAYNLTESAPVMPDPALNPVWQSGLHSTIRFMQTHFSNEVWLGISPTFYTTFWQLSLYDIFCPQNQYLTESNNQKKAIRQLEIDIAQLERARDHGMEEPRKMAEEVKKKRKEIERTNVVVATLEREWRLHDEHVHKVMERLRLESGEWFRNSVNRTEVVNTMIQYCLFPRCIQSPADASFTAKFIMTMHSLGTPSIATATLYDKIFGKDLIHACIFSSTEEEAKNYGSFLAAILKTLAGWHKSADLFKKEAIGQNLPGFLKKWPAGSPFQKIDLSHADYIDYEEFRQALRKWHLKMTKAIKACLDSKEYMQVRNGILVLDRIHEWCPATKQLGSALELSLMEIERTETRADLKQMARSFGTKLKLRKDFWVDMKDFCKVASSSDRVSGDRRESEIPVSAEQMKVLEERDKQRDQTSTRESGELMETEVDKPMVKIASHVGIQERRGPSQASALARAAPASKTSAATDQQKPGAPAAQALKIPDARNSPVPRPQVGSRADAPIRREELRRPDSKAPTGAVPPSRPVEGRRDDMRREPARRDDAQRDDGREEGQITERDGHRSAAAQRVSDRPVMPRAASQSTAPSVADRRDRADTRALRDDRTKPLDSRSNESAGRIGDRPAGSSMVKEDQPHPRNGTASTTHSRASSKDGERDVRDRDRRPINKDVDASTSNNRTIMDRLGLRKEEGAAAKDAKDNKDKRDDRSRDRDKEKDRDRERSSASRDKDKKDRRGEREKDRVRDKDRDRKRKERDNESGPVDERKDRKGSERDHKRSRRDERDDGE
ncbi:THO complex subunit 2 [Gaertneriomyces sp. JEL0708]|nr:THO complex subunit 2 [Gaertneriomyces sp. JEL0708]